MKSSLSLHILAALSFCYLFSISMKCEAQLTTFEGRQRKGELIKRYVEPLISLPQFANLKFKEPMVWHTNDYGSLDLPDEGADHAKGVFRIRNVNSVVYENEPLEAGVYSESEVRVISEGTRLWEHDVAKSHAFAFLEKAFPWFFIFGTQEPIVSEVLKSNGLWEFNWSRVGNEQLPIATAHAQVRAIDGKIVQFSAVKIKGPWPTHKILPLQAKEKAVEYSSKNVNVIQENSVKVMSIKLTELSEKSVYYEVYLEALSRDEDLLVGMVQVDALDGTLLTKEINWKLMRKMILSPMNVSEDILPVWTSFGLTFISNRILTNRLSNTTFPRQQFLKTKENQLFSLTMDLEREPSKISGSSGSDWTTIQRQGWAYGENLRTGDYRILGNPERPAYTPVINGEGSWAVICGTGHSGNRDYDLMSDYIIRDPKFGLRGRAVLPNSNEHHPLFSLDNKWLFFITTQSEKGQRTHILRRTASKSILSKELQQLDKKHIETIIPNLPGNVLRLSMFPNGERLLIQTDKGIFAAEIATKKLIPISPKDLKDTELGSVPIVEIQDGWAGPTDDRVTFSGKTTDKEGNVRRRIYSCRFDGSDLKAHTPKENTPVPMFKFPGSDKTAYDVAKEWALNEIKWEDEHRQRN